MGGLPRFFVPPDAVQEERVHLTGDALHHLRTVLRLQKGARVSVFDGAGKEYDVDLVSVTGGEAVGQVVTMREDAMPLCPAFTFVQALIPSAKMDWVMQKGTELGVDQFIPLHFARSVVKLPEERADRRVSRWQKIAIGASEQCGRRSVPQVMPMQSCKKWLTAFPAAPQSKKISAGGSVVGLLLSEQSEFPTLKSHLHSLAAAPQQVVLVVGPEGGMIEEEHHAFVQRGFAPVSLGKRILRTETAGLAALAMLNYEYHL